MKPLGRPQRPRYIADEIAGGPGGGFQAGQSPHPLHPPSNILGGEEEMQGLDISTALYGSL